MSIKFAIFGLGNPGARYAMTRHNVGFMVLDRLAERNATGFRAGRGDYFISGPVAVGQEVELLLVKPSTFMNHSGRAVKSFIDYFKFEANQILVVLDDFQLPFGKLRLRSRGSEGGHNGLRSIISILGDENFARLRIGIGGDETPDDSANYVLSNFDKAQQVALMEIIDRSCEGVVDFALNGIEHAMNRFN